MADKGSPSRQKPEPVSYSPAISIGTFDVAGNARVLASRDQDLPVLAKLFERSYRSRIVGVDAIEFLF